MKPLFSVVMPAYNAGKYIRESIDSLIGQSMPDWELIVVDDHSTDDTPRILEKYVAQDARIKMHRMSCNSGGAYRPRGKAISLAEADWIVYLDSDDMLEKDYLLKLKHRIAEVPDAKLLLTRMVIADSDGKPTGRVYPDSGFDMGKVACGRDLVKATFIKWAISFGGIAADKDTTLKVMEIMDTQDAGPYIDEIMSRYQLIHTAKVAFTDAWYYYRTNPASITHMQSVKLFSFLNNNIRLTKLTCEHFGKDSEEYELSQAELYLKIFASLRRLSRQRMSEEESATALEIIQNAMRNVDWNIMKRRLSLPRYLFTRYAPLRMFILIFQLGLYK